MTQAVLVNACDANTGVSVVELLDGRRRVVRSRCIGGCWCDEATMTAPISLRAAQRLVAENARFVDGPTQARFIEEATMPADRRTL